MDSNSSSMTCLVFSSDFVSSDNFSVIVSLNNLQSNGSTLLQLSVDVAALPSFQPGSRIDWQEVTTIAVAAGIVVSLVRLMLKCRSHAILRCRAGFVCRNRLLLLHCSAP
jgi:hypothetical protein